MSLSPGARLGPYEILSALGVGGMGEVYRARDTKLNRDVAIKVLLPAVANDPDRLARFSREAQVLASLNHPNIAQIYGIEDAAIVMELVEGEDLAQRIARGPIPLDEALPIARQIAERARSRARPRHRPSRSEARQHQGPRRRHSEGARLRSGESDRSGLREPGSGLRTEARYTRRGGASRMFDLHPDGARFAFAPVEQSPGTTRDTVVIVFNFLDELRRIAPVVTR